MPAFFWLYRATAPSVRAQAIQVVHAAHAFAARGHRVVLPVDPAAGDVGPAAVLAGYGLPPVPTLEIVVLPRNPLGSWVFRARALAHAQGGGVFVARSKRYARELIRCTRARVILEVHEVDSRQAAERGADPAPLRALEAEVLEGAVGVVANCPGTLALLRRTHARLPPAVALHNATRADRVRRPTGDGVGALYAGSVRAYKGIDVLARAAAKTRCAVTVLGADPADATPMRALSGGRLTVEPPVPHGEVPDRLARARVLVLPTGGGLFGRWLTSPLKLWDYLASGRAIVAADTPALRDAAGAAAAWYRPGDAVDLARVLDRVHDDAAERAALVARARVRTWADRAAELDAFVARVLA